MTKVISFKEGSKDFICTKVQDFLNTLNQDQKMSAKVTFQVIVGKTGFGNGNFIHFAYIIYEE